MAFNWVARCDMSGQGAGPKGGSGVRSLSSPPSPKAGDADGASCGSLDSFGADDSPCEPSSGSAAKGRRSKAHLRQTRSQQRPPVMVSREPPANPDDPSDWVCHQGANGRTFWQHKGPGKPPREITAFLTVDFLATFNASASPKEALRAAQDAELSPEALGRLLRESGDAVSPSMLGECLGYHGAFGIQLADRYPELFNEFAGMDIVAALRLYLWRFRLPGESQQIERILTGFSRSFFWKNYPTPRGAGPWDAWASGWYVEQPQCSSGQNCCVHCGALDDDLRPCEGCKLIYFCVACRMNASRQGHAVQGSKRFGRACVAVRRQAECLQQDAPIEFKTADRHTVSVSEASLCWERRSPFRSEDSVLVLAYAIVMLNTDLHNVKVKTKKMPVHGFIANLREQNAGSNFPGDFLAQVYESIRDEELKVRTSEQAPARPQGRRRGHKRVTSVGW